MITIILATRLGWAKRPLLAQEPLVPFSNIRRLVVIKHSVTCGSPFFCLS